MWSLYAFQAYEDRHGMFGIARTTVVVYVTDVNEPPEFLNSHYTTVVSEGAGVGEPLFNGIIAFDLDEVSGYSYCIYYQHGSYQLLQNNSVIAHSTPTLFRKEVYQ